MTPTLRVKRLTPTATLPNYAKPGDAGMDLCSDGEWVVPIYATVKIPTGIAIEIPEGYEAQVRPRSGLSLLGRVAILGTIDAGYRGEVGVIVRNDSPTPWRIQAGDRIAQLIVTPVARCAIVEAEELSTSERGAMGFGSTGIGPQSPAGRAKADGEGDGCGGEEIVDSRAICAPHDGDGRGVE